MNYGSTREVEHDERVLGGIKFKHLTAYLGEYQVLYLGELLKMTSLTFDRCLRLAFLPPKLKILKYSATRIIKYPH